MKMLRKKYKNGDDGNDNYGDGHRVWDDDDYES